MVEAACGSQDEKHSTRDYIRPANPTFTPEQQLLQLERRNISAHAPPSEGLVVAVALGDLS